MALYTITDGYGSYIRRDAFSGKWVPVRCRALAEEFDQRTKADRILRSSINKKLRKRYFVEEVESSNDPAKPGVKPPAIKKDKNDVVKKIASETIEEGQSDKWSSGVDDLMALMLDAEKRREILNQEMSLVDKEIVDIERFIEFGKFNAYQGWLAFSMLQQRLRKRRKIKNEIQILLQLGECKVTSSMMIDIQNAIKDLENQKYHPRVLMALFE